MRHQLIFLSIKLLIFYLFTIGGLIWVVITFPESRQYLPVGGIDELPTALLETAGDDGKQTSVVRVDRAITLLTALVGGLLFVLPIVTVYKATRTKVRNSIVEAIVLLPIIVTTVIFVVQNSIALAFSLAGIVAAVRFRYNLRSPADAVFIFAVIAVGIAAGVEEVGVAGAGSLVFNAAAIVLAYTRIGETITGDEGRSST